MSITQTVLPANTSKLTTITGLSGVASSLTQPTRTPLQPTNVSAVENGSTITVTATVYIDAADPLTSLDIYITNSLIDGNTQGVYIVYDYVEEVPASLKEYTISFDIQDPTGVITEIESYLWDEDPVGSRGTKTPVNK